MLRREAQSNKDADWYKQKLFDEKDAIGGHIFIARETTMKRVAAIRLPSRDIKDPNSDDLLRAGPVLRLVLAAGHNDREVAVESAESVPLLVKMENRLREYPSIVKQLIDLQKHMH